jgi:hypothetical protein
MLFLQGSGVKMFCRNEKQALFKDAKNNGSFVKKLKPAKREYVKKKSMKF